jgi:hypothetical protein
VSADALLVLTGFGYGRAGRKALRALAPSIAGSGLDLYLPPYVTRSGLLTSRAKLDRFIREQRLDRYERLHVFAFIAGAWTLNPLVDRVGLPNLTTVVYDRSPFQERAPKVAADTLPVPAWILYGSTLFDVAKMPYPPLEAAHVDVGLIVETAPTSFIRRFKKAARAYGPFQFGSDAFNQRHRDRAYVPLNHDEMYARFAEVWPELLSFIRTRRFTDAANRTAPAVACPR